MIERLLDTFTRTRRTTLSLTLGAGVLLSACSSSDVTAPVRVVIPRGASFKAASDSLQKRGVIRSARMFRWYASFSGSDRTIKPGTYELHRGQDWDDILDALVSGKSLSVTVTIPEGFDLRNITPLLVRSLGVTEDSVRVAVSDSAWIAKLEVPIATLEGYLFPDTYKFSSGTTAREAVHAMLERFLEVWKPEWNARLDSMGINRHEAITMASIVEKEARVAHERPVIAAVYWNRLERNMRLQADPTVQYALPAHVSRVLYKDLEVESKYNTYQNDGLPPGPISSPGVASIEAALNPADVTYLYFVAHPDGHHEFRNTFAEHQRAVQMMRRANAANRTPAANGNSGRSR